MTCHAAAPAPIRSFLFVPGDAPHKMQKALAAGADALILDLEDAVMPDRKPEARRIVADFCTAHRGQPGPALWIRINPVATQAALPDLAAIMHTAPAGLVVPKVDGPADLIRLSHYLDAFEQQHNLPPGSTRLLTVATETPASLFSLGSYSHSPPRLFGLTWGAEDLAAGLNASTNRADEGTLAFTYQLARSLCLAGARAAGVTPVETAMMNFRDPEAVFHYASLGRQDGFFGMMAIHPDQVQPINRAFSPTTAEITAAEDVVAAFAKAGGAGAVALNGRMLDIPHLRQAQHLLNLAQHFPAPTPSA
jgi:citrate lyase subunit beta / citryl-CoA lyase